MQPIIEKSSPHAATEPVVCEVVQGRDFGCVWHYHPECEITLIIKGGTSRQVGTQLTHLEAGDLVFLGPNVPHDYRNDALPGQSANPVEAIVIQFMPQLPGQEDWLSRASMKPIQRLFERSVHGLEITGITRLTATRIVHDMARSQGMKRVIQLLQLLDLLAGSEDVHEICRDDVVPGPALPKNAAQDRVGRACEHISAHLAEPIYVEELAAMVGLGKSAFSRLFKRSTGRTLPQYVNELRIARACTLLADTDLTVNQISMECGFVSAAHFQRTFKEHQHCAPLAYRQRISALH